MFPFGTAAVPGRNTEHSFQDCTVIWKGIFQMKRDRSKVKFSFVLHSFSNISYLMLKWCKMSFYFIHFQCEMLNMTSLDVNNKWVCTFHTGIFLFVIKSNSMPFLIKYVSWRFRNELKISNITVRSLCAYRGKKKTINFLVRPLPCICKFANH